MFLSASKIILVAMALTATSTVHGSHLRVHSASTDDAVAASAQHRMLKPGDSSKETGGKKNEKDNKDNKDNKTSTTTTTNNNKNTSTNNKNSSNNNTNRNGNIGSDGQCQSIPASCANGGGGVNCGFWRVINQPTTVNRAVGSNYPAFNKETCIFEPKPCIDLRGAYDKAQMFVSSINTMTADERTKAVSSVEWARHQEMLSLADPRCFAPNGSCNQRGACCRFHDAQQGNQMVCDNGQDDPFTTNPCICNDFTLDKALDDGFTR